MNEGTIIAFKDEGGLRISKDNTNIKTGKVIVNGIEITSVEDWEKVTQSIVELQQENNQLKDRINKAIEYIEKETEIYDKNPIEGSWLYNIYQILDLLKGDKE